MSSSTSISSRWLGTISYEDALATQLELHAAILAGEAQEQVLHLEHLPVYTIGRTQDQSSLRGEHLPHPVHIISRGGQATYHGPGQLVSYPLIDLNQRRKDLHAYLRALEEALIVTCQNLGVPAQRREGLTGIWVEQRKLASIGVGIRRWLTFHGLAINVRSEALRGFAHITPCGLDGVRMTSLEDEGVADLSPQQFSELLQPNLETAMADLGSKLA